MTLLLSKPSGTPVQCEEYILRHKHGEYTAWDVKVIVAQYFGYANMIDPVNLVAQMIHETGNMTSWWSARPRRNPAGIGVTGRKYDGRGIMPGGHWALHPDGSWHEGNSYPDWMQGIWSHIGRVLCYRFTRNQGTRDQQNMMEQAVRDRPFPSEHRGQHKHWENMNGVWAVPGTYYAQSILRIASDIVRV